MIIKLLDFYSLLFAKKVFAKLNKLIFLAGARGLGILNYKTPYQSGEEPFLRQFLAGYDRSDSIVIDVGANEGQFASWVLRNTTSLRVISFEPNPYSAERLKGNLKDFSERHLLIEKGASSSMHNAVMYDYPNGTGSSHASIYESVIVDLHGSEGRSQFSVSLTTIDQELSPLSSGICLLKIDIEGHEFDALLGARQLLESRLPAAVLIEFNEMNAVSGAHYYKFRQLLEASYAPYRLLPGGNLLPLQGETPLFTEIYAYQNLVFLRRA
jgi:FkbM family methyltransferase